jgi:hypothetical protein
MSAECPSVITTPPACSSSLAIARRFTVPVRMPEVHGGPQLSKMMHLQHPITDDLRALCHSSDIHVCCS